jgi:Bax protein
VNRLTGGLATAAVSLGLAAWLASVRLAGPALPDFSQWPAGTERKEQFFAFLRPLFEAENARIAAQRQRLVDLGTDGHRLSPDEQHWLHELASDYGLDPETLDADLLLAELRVRVDLVPVSLGLAQAAKESGWGTSRFAVEGNALFGQRCHEPGCGLVPEGRASGDTFEVRAFDTPSAAISSYVRNLNSHDDYQPLRHLRAELRAAGRRVTGFTLARTLSTYSERGIDYVEELRQLIHFNGLGPVEHEG